MMQHILVVKMYLRTVSDENLNDVAYEIARNLKYDGYQRTSASMIYKFFDKKIGPGVSANEKIAEKLHKPVIQKFKKGKVYARFKEFY